MKCANNGECNILNSTVVPQSADARHEAIRRLAQRNYEKRGRAPGHALDDWLKAERMVKKGSAC